MTLIVIAFVCLFVLTVVCIQLGTRYLETQRKKRVAGMLQVVGAETAAVVTTSLLKDYRNPGDGSALERLFKSLDIVRRADDMIQQAALTWSTTRLFRTMAVMAMPGLLLGILFPVLINAPITCLVFGATGAALPYLFVRRLRNKRMAKLETQLPDAMDFLSRSMRAGHAFVISLGMVGEDLPDPLGQEFRTLYNEQNLGASMNSAFDSLNRRVPLLDMRFFSSAVLLQRQTGGNLSEILGRLSEVIRERFRLRGHVKAVSAHGRMTAGILTALPVVTAVALLLVAPGYLQGMFSDPDGKKLVAGAVLSQVIGNLIIRKIIRIKV
jgi:tight adherence protein B